MTLILIDFCLNSKLQAIIEYWQGFYFYLFGDISIASTLPKPMLWHSVALAMMQKHLSGQVRWTESTPVSRRSSAGWVQDHLAIKCDLTCSTTADICAVVTKAKLLINMSDFKSDCNKVDSGLWGSWVHKGNRRTNLAGLPAFCMSKDRTHDAGSINARTT